MGPTPVSVRKAAGQPEVTCYSHILMNLHCSTLIDGASKNRHFCLCLGKGPKIGIFACACQKSGRPAGSYLLFSHSLMNLHCSTFIDGASKKRHFCLCLGKGPKIGIFACACQKSGRPAGSYLLFSHSLMNLHCSTLIDGASKNRHFCLCLGKGPKIGIFACACQKSGRPAGSYLLLSHSDELALQHPHRRCIQK